jgi:hypothetical protein
VKVCFCGQEFKPYHSGQKYCSLKCQHNNPEKRETTLAFQRERRERLNRIKVEAGCARCGFNAHPAALDFNHIRGEKKFNISQDPKRAWADIEAEMAKCEVLCRNCHSIYTYENWQFVANRRDRQPKDS